LRRRRELTFDRNGSVYSSIVILRLFQEAAMLKGSFGFIALVALQTVLPISAAPAQTAVTPDIVTGDVWPSPPGPKPAPPEAAKSHSPGEVETVTGDVWTFRKTPVDTRQQAVAPLPTVPNEAQAANR
jgi:hypothetical protein